METMIKWWTKSLLAISSFQVDCSLCKNITANYGIPGNKNGGRELQDPREWGRRDVRTQNILIEH